MLLVLVHILLLSFYSAVYHGILISEHRLSFSSMCAVIRHVSLTYLPLTSFQVFLFGGVGKSCYKQQREHMGT